MANFGRRALRHLQRWRWFYAAVLAGLLARETFPFSHWPMYASFGPTTSYVYVTDSDGQPVAHLTVLRVSSGTLKKRLYREAERTRAEAARNGSPIDASESLRRGAERILPQLALRISPADRTRLRGLRLVFVEVADRQRVLVHTNEALAELALAPLPSAP
jgi:hypothetical protein